MSTNHLPDCELTPPVKTRPVWHTYVEVDGQRVAESTGATTTQNPYGPATALTHNYFHLDDQGTISLVTNDNFNANTLKPIPQNELSDVFGQPRLTTGATDPSWGANDVTKRRYINQEDLTDAHLIDLNARIYDPLLGKFLSPDPVISDQDDSQSWNAYAYSHNNPMSKEDPTGFWYVQGVNPSSSAASFGGGSEYDDTGYPTEATIWVEGTTAPPAQEQQKSVQNESTANGDRSGTDSRVSNNDKLVTGPGHVTVDEKAKSETLSGDVYDNGTGQGKSFINAVDSKNGGWSGKFKGLDGSSYDLTTSLHLTKDPTQAIVGLSPCPGGSCGKGIAGYAERGGFWISLPPSVSATTDRHEFGHILGLGHQTSRDSIMEYHGGNGVVGQQDLDRVGQHYLDEGLRFQRYMQSH